jgi:hypothetical protein
MLKYGISQHSSDQLIIHGCESFALGHGRRRVMMTYVTNYSDILLRNHLVQSTMLGTPRMGG